jgi:hypothetical protein
LAGDDHMRIEACHLCLQVIEVGGCRLNLAATLDHRLLYCHDI